MTKEKQASDRLCTALFIILSGGLQDAYTYSCRGGVFANAQTGNIVLMSIRLFHGQWAEALKYLIPVLAFLLGTLAAQHIRRFYGARRCLHWRQLVLALEMALLWAVGFLSQEGNPLANALVSFVCAMQVQAFRKVRGHVYASTMCIGNMRSGMEALHTYLCTRERAALQQALVYLGVIVLFAIGAGTGALLTERFGEKAIWASSLLLLVSFCLMFAKTSEKAY